MSKSNRQGPRKPATKFPHLRKKMQQVRTPARPLRPRKRPSG